MNQLEKVKEFHILFEHPVLPSPAITTDKRCKLRVDLISEELEELKQAIEDKDIVEVGDALIDLLYVVNGAMLEFGFAGIGEKLFDEVHRSNMSKACKDLDEVNATIDHYGAQGTASYFRTKEVFDKDKNKKTVYLVYRQEDDKLLKSVNYSPADLKSLIKF